MPLKLVITKLFLCHTRYQLSFEFFSSVADEKWYFARQKKRGLKKKREKAKRGGVTGRLKWGCFAPGPGSTLIEWQATKLIGGLPKFWAMNTEVVLNKVINLVRSKETCFSRRSNRTVPLSELLKFNYRSFYRFLFADSDVNSQPITASPFDNVMHEIIV